MIDHFVYLANTSGLKVGITRGTQIPTRWIDQGATEALPYSASEPPRFGSRRSALRPHVADKTAWQANLKGPGEVIDLAAARDRLREAVPARPRASSKRSGASVPVTWSLEEHDPARHSTIPCSSTRKR
jgi:hypothetical protein